MISISEVRTRIRASNILALSVRQPWPWCMSIPGDTCKDIENRSWRTNVRGTVLIHASSGMTRDEYEFCLAYMHEISLIRMFPAGLVMPEFDKLERGGIVGVVEIIDCVKESESPWFMGPWGFVLRNYQSLPFMPCRGMPGFFKPTLTEARAA